MNRRVYTLVILPGPDRKMIKVAIPASLVRKSLAAVAAVLITLVIFAVTYGRMLMKVSDYNALRTERQAIENKYLVLTAEMEQADEKLVSLRSLAREVALSYRLTQPRRGRRTRSRRAKPTLIPEILPVLAHRQDASLYAFDVLKANLPWGSNDAIRPVSFTEDEYLEYFNPPSEWPVRGYMTSYFGQRIDPFLGEGRFHSGIDIVAPFGSLVTSPADGLVVYAGRNSYGYGNMVILNHGHGIKTKLAHLSGILVSVGWKIKRGQPVAHLGSSGRSTGPHLHYEILMNEIPVNPIRFLRATRKSEPEGVKIRLVAFAAMHEKCRPSDRTTASAKLQRASTFQASAAGM